MSYVRCYDASGRKEVEPIIIMCQQDGWPSSNDNGTAHLSRQRRPDQRVIVVDKRRYTMCIGTANNLLYLLISTAV